MGNDAAIPTSGYLPWLHFGDFRIQTYFIVISLVLSLSALWIPRRAERFGLQPRMALDLFLSAMLGGFLGSRLFHILWEEPAYYSEDLTRIFDVLSGGFVWYGGAIGGLLAMWMVFRFRRETHLLKWLDFFAPVAALGYAGGRIACVLTGCCFGAVCDWPFHGLDESVISFRLPSQGFAVIWELAAAFFLLSRESKTFWTLRPGRIFFFWCLLHGVGRILMEWMRADARGPAYGPVTISMLISALIVLVGIFGFVSGTRVSRVSQ